MHSKDRPRRGPDFMVIGAQGAGTTWLFAQLKKNPKIWLPPVKELHHFSRSPEYGSPSGPDFHLSIQLIKKAIRQNRWRQITWFAKYLSGGSSDNWYKSLFPRVNSQVRGEITPAYALLSDADVKRIHALFPHLKIVFLLRDPVDRLLTSIRKTKSEAHLAKLSQEDLLTACNSKWKLARSNYLHTLTTWERFFPKEQIRVFFYDHIEDCPEKLIQQISEFLEVPVVISKHLNKRFNASYPFNFDPALRCELYRKFLPLLEELDRRFDGPPRQWLETARASLTQTAIGE